MSLSRPRAGVLGHPIAHSKSPVLHRAAYQALGLDIAYDAHDLRPEQLDRFVGEIRAGQAARGTDRWVGCSVTMPHKAAMVPQMDQVSERVHLLGVLNTVVWDRDGTATGHNTDVDGIVRALEFAGYDSLQRGGTLTVVGGGGTAAAAVAAARGLGLDAVQLLLRSPEKAADLIRLAEQLELQATAHPLEELNARAPSSRAVIVTLPPRAADPLAAALTPPASDGVLPPLLDVAYDPWPSALALAWESHGGRVVSGLEMLLYQAVEQVRLFTEQLRRGDAEPDWAAVTAYMAGAVGLPPR